MQIRFLVALIFSILVAVFALLNAQPVEVNFLFSKARFSLALVILGSAAIGALIAGLLSALKHISAMWKIHELEKQVKQQSESLEKLNQSTSVVDVIPAPDDTLSTSPELSINNEISDKPLE
jgi:uncharacterized integral membrane protein